MKRRDLIKASLALAALPLATHAADVVGIAIDRAKSLGPADVIGDLIGSQYEPYTFSFRQPDPWGIEAWREIGFNIGDIALFNFEGSNPYTVSGKIVGIHVSRNAAGKLHLDFGDFDRNIEFLRRELGARRIDFTVWGTPKALADPAAGATFFFHAPANYQEWTDIVQAAVRHIKDDLGLAGSSYKPWTEPDSGYYWRGRARDGEIISAAADAEAKRAVISQDRRVLEDYVEKYVVDWHAIKAVDPTAKVGGAFTVYSVPLAPVNWSLDDFLDRIEVYNRQHPASPVTVDELVYQDYNWRGNGLAEGVVAANALIKKHALPATTPLVLGGWNNGMKNDQSLQQRAAYLAANIMREIAPVGRPRTLARAYLWPFDYDYYAEGLGPVSMPYGPVTYSGDDGSDGPMSIAAVTGYRKRPAHAALKLLAMMRPGQRIGADIDDPGVTALASVDTKESIRLVIANESPKTRRIDASVAHSPLLGRQVRLTTQRVDATHSADGAGLEAGESRRLELGASGALPRFDLPAHSVIGISLERT